MPTPPESEGRSVNGGIAAEGVYKPANGGLSTSVYPYEKVLSAVVKNPETSPVLQLMNGLKGTYKQAFKRDLVVKSVATVHGAGLDSASTIFESLSRVDVLSAKDLALQPLIRIIQDGENDIEAPVARCSVLHNLLHACGHSWLGRMPLDNCHRR